jgi:hypothetical protein
MFGAAVACLCIAAAASESPPSDWIARISAAQMLYNDKPLNDTRLYAHVGNGNVATVIDSPSIYIAGIFNNAASAKHGGRPFRARVPSLSRINIKGALFMDEALDLERAVFYRRLSLAGSGCQLLIEQRWYAHREIKELLVTEIEADASSCAAPQSIEVMINTGGTSADINFARNGEKDIPTWVGQAAIPENFGAAPHVAFASPLAATLTTTPGSLTLTATAAERSTFVFPIALASSDPLDASPVNVTALAQTAHSRCAAALGKPTTGDKSLLETHIASYGRTMLSSRVELTGDLELARVINASFYALYASLRGDSPWSTSPGGEHRASTNYSESAQSEH